MTTSRTVTARVVAVFALLCASVLALTLAESAPAGAYPAGICPLLTVSTTSPVAGSTMTASGQSFTPGAHITLEFGTTSPVVLGHVVVDSAGTFSTSFTVPNNVGNSTLMAVGEPASSGCTASAFADVGIVSGGGTSTGGGSGGLAVTGADVAMIAGGALVLLAGGTALLLAGRRRRAATTTGA